MISNSIQKVAQGNDLSVTEMEKTMAEVINGTVSPSQVGAFVTALRMKRETVDEITGAVKALQSNAIKLELSKEIISMDRDDINFEDETIQTVRSIRKNETRIFNVSTATTFVVAGSGIKIIRYGNRDLSLFFGNSNVLEALEINLDIPITEIKRCIEEVGIGFLYAPIFNSPMRFVARLRREIGIRTVFNLIGPLINPANAQTQVLGVYEADLTEKIAEVLKKLKVKQAFVCCGAGTDDEISICGATKISQLKNGQIDSYTIEPEDYGFDRVKVDVLRGGNVRENAKIIKAILDGEKGPRRDIVMINSAAAFVAAGLDGSLKDGIARAAEIIDSGGAREKLNKLVRFTAQCQPFLRNELL